MRVSREKAAENRETVINVASRLFREHGFDGIGLKDLMKGAGLTQGAFYKQFASKEDLAVLASRRAFESASHRWSDAIEAHPENPLGAVLAFYLSMDHREEKMEGCPIVGLGSDAARQGSDVKSSFEDGVKTHLEVLGELVGKSGDAEPNSKAMSILSTMIGAQVLARVVNDKKLSSQILHAAAQSVLAQASAGSDEPGSVQ
ncbi:TetR/AcrR family transcriptional regulator [Roseibium suaedae]|uniref:Transcriptional regulator, TetR family n=1 Tax=Roseibium suaedae TaxID=735517 RepID=A0A1M7PJX6_9HYPH|nr:TetR/AcrR family transcriptional regulator [Roseibium suaedae]SHN17506.1 transcriptional regulator, TetR family [Roseibium suaedae]